MRASGESTGAACGSGDQHSAYDREEEIGGCGLGSNMWVVAEACKVKDALFLGNVMAVQDANFLVMNKIAYCIKCQTGFAVAQTMKRAGVNYAVINLLEKRAAEYTVPVSSGMPTFFPWWEDPSFKWISKKGG